jgi:hypothetical protein
LESIFNELENATLEVYELKNICDSLISNMFDCLSLPKKYNKDYFNKLLELLKEFMPQEAIHKEDIIKNSSNIRNALTIIFDESLIDLDIMKAIEESNFTYNEEIDYICLIVDRDKNSFTSKQYRYVKSKCEIANFKFYVTNPCFEFWLMLHFSKCDDIDEEKIKQNKVNHKLKKTFCEIELDKLIPDKYNKNCFRVDTCVDKVDIAIKNSKRYETNIDLLKDNVGSNLFEFFDFLRNDKN